MTQLSEIDSQQASTLVCNHMICPHCGVVDRNSSRMKRGFPCPTCGVPGEAGRLFFPINFHILVDMIQQAYHSSSPIGPLAGPQSPTVATILFFCSLREALLTHFITNLLNAQRIPERIIDKLLDDNKLANQKFGDLFASIAGHKWDKAVKHASTRTGIDFEPISSLMKQAATIRNSFLHGGTAWSATPKIAAGCIDQLPTLFRLFVSLHNIYIHPLHRSA